MILGWQIDDPRARSESPYNTVIQSLEALVFHCNICLLLGICIVRQVGQFRPQKSRIEAAGSFFIKFRDLDKIEIYFFSKCRD